jgi:hypothetical protein
LENSQLNTLVLDLLVLFHPGDVALIDTLNGRVEPALIAFTHTSTVEALSHIRFHEDIEVT